MKNILLTILLIITALTFSACEKKDAHFDEDKIKRLIVEPLIHTMDVNVSQQYEAIAIYESGKKEIVTERALWSIKNETIATINRDAIAKSRNIGQTLVIATLDEIKGEALLIVKNKIIQELNIYPASSRIYLGTTENYRVMARYKDGTVQNVTMDVEWELENRSNIISKYSETDSRSLRVSSNVLDNIVYPFTTAKGDIVGQDTLVAILRNAKAEAYVEVVSSDVVGPSPKSLVISPKSQTVLVGVSTDYTATLYYEDGSSTDVSMSAIWSSSNQAVATISNEYPNGGTSLALSVGDTTIAASFEGLSDMTNLNVHTKTISEIQITPVNKTVALGSAVQYSAIAIFEDATTQDITNESLWSSSDESVATISNGVEIGKATTNLAGKTMISVQYSGQTVQTQLNVTDATVTSIAITPASISVPKGTTGTYTAIAYYSNGDSRDITLEATWISENSKIVSIESLGFTSGFAQALSVGDTKISAMYSGQKSNIADVSVTDAILRELHISPIKTIVALGSTVAYQAIGVYSDNSSVDLTKFSSWQSSDPSKATIDSNGLAKTLESGETKIMATFEAISTSEASLIITKATMQSLQITPANIEVPAGTQGRFTAMAYYSDGSSADVTDLATWQSEDSQIVSIISTGLNGGMGHALKVGITYISATLDGMISNKAKVNVSQSVVKTLNVTPVQTTVVNGISVQYQAIAIYSDGFSQDVTAFVPWSCDTSIATMMTNGLALTHAAGTTEITTNLDGIVGTASLTVVEAKLLSIQVTPGDMEVVVGTKGSFSATAYYDNGSDEDVTEVVTWNSSNMDAVSIVTSGINGGFGDALASGVSNVTATLGSVKSQSVVVTVVSNITLVSIGIDTRDNHSSPVLVAKDANALFAAYAIYSDNSYVDITIDANWISSNTSVATVVLDETISSTPLANVYGVDIGTTDIGISFGGLTASQAVEVTQAKIESIQITPADITVSQGTKGNYTAIAYYDDNTNADVTLDVTWTSSKEEVVKIVATGSNAGFADALSGGNSTITATLDGVMSNIATVTVIGNPILLSIEIIATDIEFPKGATVHYTANAIYDDTGNGFGDRSVDITSEASWSSEDTSIATVAKNIDFADIYGVNAGTTNIVIVFSGETDAQSITVIDENSITLESLVITPDDLTVPVGRAGTFKALAIYSDGSTLVVTTDSVWTSSNAVVGSIVASGPDAGYAQALSVGTLTIQATYAGVASNVANIEVIAITLVSLEILPTDATIQIHTDLLYGVVGVYSDGSRYEFVNSELTWRSSDLTVATIGLDGIANGIMFGETTISATEPITGMSIATLLSVIDGCNMPISEIVSIHMVPDSATMSVGDEIQFVMYGVWSNGCEEDISRLPGAVWESSDHKVVSIQSAGGSAGLATAKAVGTAKITGKYKGDGIDTSVEAPVTVVE